MPIEAPSAKAADFVTSLAERAISLELFGEQLRYKGPSGSVTADDLSYLRTNKSAIVAHLKASSNRSSPSASPLLFAQAAMVASYPKMQDPRGLHSMIARRVGGDLNVQALEHALSLLVARHAAFRTRYKIDQAGLCTVIADPDSSLPLEQIDLSAAAADSAKSALSQTVSSFQRRRFELSGGALARALLVRVSDSVHVFVLVVHHSIFDWWSCAVVARDVFGLYGQIVTGVEASLPPTPMQLPEYAIWLHQFLASPAGKNEMNYWRHLIVDLRDAFYLPHDVPDAAAPVGETQDGCVSLTAPLAAVRLLAKQERTTVAVVLMAAYAAALADWSNLPTVTVAIAHSGRSSPAVLDMVGCLIQNWLLRADIAECMSFSEVIRHVAARTAAAQEHIHIPLGLLRAEIATRSRSPVQHIQFNYMPNASMPMQSAPECPGLASLEPYFLDTPYGALDDSRGEQLNWTINENDSHVLSWIRYSPKTFRRQSVERFVARLQALLQGDSRQL